MSLKNISTQKVTKSFLVNSNFVVAGIGTIENQHLQSISEYKRAYFYLPARIPAWTPSSMEFSISAHARKALRWDRELTHQPVYILLTDWHLRTHRTVFHKNKLTLLHDTEWNIVKFVFVLVICCKTFSILFMWSVSYNKNTFT